MLLWYNNKKLNDKKSERGDSVIIHILYDEKESF
jgi:hypothetical protein